MALTADRPLPAQIPAGVLRAPKHLEVAQIPLWPLESYNDPDLVLIEVAACGVCGSDFRYFLGENPWAQHTLGRHVPNAPNIVLGHEYAGTVAAVLDPKNAHLLGKRVAPVCSKVCGACDDCRAGRTRLCANTVHLGHGQGWGEQDFYPGAYAPFTPSWGATCFEIPDHVTFQEAALMDILAVCVHVAQVAQIQPGRPVLCIGAGPAGNGVAQAALALGASFALLLDPSEAARKIASDQGVGLALDPTSMPPSQLRERLGQEAPHGFGAVFDTVGSADTLSLGLDCLGKAGTLVNLAVHDGEIPLNFMRLGAERRMVTSCNFEVGDYPLALSWLASGRFRVKEWITEVKLTDLPGWFESVTSQSEKPVFKLVVTDWT